MVCSGFVSEFLLWLKTWRYIFPSSSWPPPSGWSPPSSGSPVWLQEAISTRIRIRILLSKTSTHNQKYFKRRLQVAIISPTVWSTFIYISFIIIWIRCVFPGVVTALVTAGPADLYNRVLCPTCILQIIAINTLLVGKTPNKLIETKTKTKSFKRFYFQFSAQLLFWSTVTLLPNAPTWTLFIILS